MRQWKLAGQISTLISGAMLGTAPAFGLHYEDIEIPFSKASVYFQLNETDGDLGVHALIDGEGWRRLKIFDPWERKLLDINVRGRLRRQGLTELFFESAEPTFDRLPPEVFFHRFPAGTYEIEGRTLNGLELESEAEVTHVMPAPAGNIRVGGQPAAENCDADVLPMVSPPVVVRWDPVTQSHPEIGEPAPDIEIVGYQFVVQREEPTLLVFSVDLPPSTTRVRIPNYFLNLGEEFKFEILAREASGNETVVETCFEME